MKHFLKRAKNCFPCWSVVLFCLFGISLIVNAFIENNTAFSHAIHSTIGAGIRTALATLTSLIPFSLAEFLLLLSPVILFLICFFMIRRLRRSLTAGIRYFIGFLSVMSLVVTVFIFGYHSCFYNENVEKTIGIERKDLSPEQLYDTAVLLIDAIRAEIPYVTYSETELSEMTFSYSQMNEKLNSAYLSLSERYPSIPTFRSNTKPVMLSEPWTYTHISGMYTFITGEANVNTNYPDFIMISSAAHEMAHQRGIGKEDEANFIAFLVCSLSDDPYVRYCGYADVLNEVMNQLYSANYDLYVKARAEMPQELKNEYRAYSLFFDQYRENVAANVSDTVNNAYITSHNQPKGIQSYGLVADLVAAYMLSQQ